MLFWFSEVPDVYPGVEFSEAIVRACIRMRYDITEGLKKFYMMLRIDPAAIATNNV